MRGRDATDEPPVVRLDEASPLPKYQQIVEQIKTHVAEGRLSPGAHLPSVRQLATDLGINVNTVVAAYRALEAEGVLLLRHGSGAQIDPHLAQRPPPGPGDLARLRAQLERVRTEARLAGVSDEVLAALAAEVLLGPDRPSGLSPAERNDSDGRAGPGGASRP